MASFLVNKFSRKKFKKMNNKKIKYDFEQNMEDFIFSLFSYSSLVQETKESLKIAGKKLGNLGWTVPEEVPIPFLTEIVEEKYVGTIYAQLKSLTSFNEKLYGTKDFAKIEEDIINRNILFHGRGFNIGKVEVIQMANAIESVCSICEIINSVEKIG